MRSIEEDVEAIRAAAAGLPNNKPEGQGAGETALEESRTMWKRCREDACHMEEIGSMRYTFSTPRELEGYFRQLRTKEELTDDVLQLIVGAAFRQEPGEDTCRGQEEAEIPEYIYNF